MNDIDQSGGPDELVQIDLPNGVAAHLTFFSTGMNFLESLAYDARENVLWTTNDGELYRVDPVTYDAVLIGDTGQRDIDGLTVNPGNGRLYGITHGGNDLILIDKLDAHVSVINGSVEVGSRLEDLAFGPDGRLFILTSNALVEIDPIDGSRMLKARLNGASSLEGLIWWEERSLFLSAADRGRFKDLVTLDLAGNVAFLSEKSSGFRDIEALAFVPRGTEVPVAMQAGAVVRDTEGVHLEWSTPESVESFVIQRSSYGQGPWQVIGQVQSPASGLPGDWGYAFTDLEAANYLQTGQLYYRVGAADDQGVWNWVHFAVSAIPLPTESVLLGNAPNPFNPNTTFRVELTQSMLVELQIFDIRGRLVYTRSPRLVAGKHDLIWDGRDRHGNAMPSGVYPYLIRAGRQQLRGRAILTK